MSDLFSLQGKTALVTGGSRGLGAGVAEELLRAGARVIVTARGAEELEATAASLSELGPCDAVAADLSTRDGIDALVAATGELADGRLDVLVNNAGAFALAPIEDFPEETWDEVMAMNVKWLHYLTAGCLPLLRAAASPEEPARVINIGSTDGFNAPLIDSYAYGASKAAVHQLTRHYARRLAPEHVLVNAIAPGVFQTGMSAFIWENERFRELAEAMVPVKRMGHPREIGGTAVYLASRAGAYTNGEVIVVDGGRTGAGRAD